MNTLIRLLIAAGLASTIGCGGEEKTEEKAAKVDEKPIIEDEETSKEEATIVDTGVKKLVAKFSPTDIGMDESKIPEQHRTVIAKLVEAAEIMDDLYLNQVSAQNPKWREELAGDPSHADTLAAFDIMYGPWNRLDHNKPFFGEVEKPKGATFYPEDIKKEELEGWIESHPDLKEAFTGYFTVIQRDGDGLKAVPYSEFYKKWLEPAAKLLDEAAELAKDARLKKYLTARAKAFRDNEYRQSDMDWMDLGDGDIEIVIGPYEVYEDELMGYKAAFETFLALRDPEDSRDLARIKSFMPKMEAFLPIPDEHKNLSRGSESPISVVEVLFTAGDTRAGVQTLAFNLPNDEVVREKKGSKKVMLKNVAHAKFNKILVPIAGRLMREDQAKNVSFKAFFNHTLVHETAHGLGPGKITVTKDGKKVKTTVNAELKELYPAIEECKADILGSYLNYLLIEEGLHEESFVENMYASLLGGFFRSVRFGAAEAHGKSNIIQFNWLMEKGAIILEDGKYVYVSEKMQQAIKSLAHEVLMIEAFGDYDKAKVMIEKYGDMPDHLKAALDGLSDIPTDLRPTYTIEEQMKGW